MSMKDCLELIIEQCESRYKRASDDILETIYNLARKAIKDDQPHNKNPKCPICNTEGKGHYTEDCLFCEGKGERFDGRGYWYVCQYCHGIHRPKQDVKFIKDKL